MAITSIEVKKNQNENNASLLRRFSRRMQESGMIQKVKSNRYNERGQSKLSQKNSALKRLAKRKANEKLRKLGKIA
jgi:ribosomal protein S21